MENAHYHGTINIEHKSLYFALPTLFLAILPFTATHFAAVPQQSIWNIFAHHLKKNLTSRLTMIRKLFTKSNCLKIVEPFERPCPAFRWPPLWPQVATSQKAPDRTCGTRLCRRKSPEKGTRKRQESNFSLLIRTFRFRLNIFLILICCLLLQSACCKPISSYLIRTNLTYDM